MKQNTIAEIQISYASHITKHERTKIKNSKDAYTVLIK